MKAFYLFALLTVAAPSIAATSTPPATPAPVQDGKSASPDPRRVYDTNRTPAPPKPKPKGGPEIG